MTPLMTLMTSTFAVAAIIAFCSSVWTPRHVPVGRTFWTLSVLLIVFPLLAWMWFLFLAPIDTGVIGLALYCS